MMHRIYQDYAEPLGDPTTVDRWHRAFEEPVRLKPFVFAAIVASGLVYVGEPIAPPDTSAEEVVASFHHGSNLIMPRALSKVIPMGFRYPSVEVPRLTAVPTIELVDSAAQAPNQTVYTFSNRSLGDPVGDRLIAVTCHCEHGLASPPNISSVTIGGQSATVVVERKTSLTAKGHVGIAIAAVPSGATGDIVVDWGNIRLSCGITVYRITGVPSTTADDTATAEGTSLGMTITIPATGVAVAAATAVEGGAGNASWTNATEQVDAEIDNNATYTAAIDAYPAGGSTTITPSFTTSDAADTACCATWGP